jgi:hypothetical protein
MPKAVSNLWWLPAIVSALLSTLSILALARHAFVTWSISAPLELVMAAYNGTMNLLFGWAQPYLQAALTWLGSFFGWRPTLYSHWKDVFVVISVIGIGAGRASWRQGDIDSVDFLFFVGPILGAAVTALAAGSLPLLSPDLTVQLLIAASLGLSVLIFFFVAMLLEGVPDVKLLGLGLIGALGVGTLSALATWLLSLALSSAAGLGLAGIASLVVLWGTLLVLLNALSTQDSDRHPFEWGLTILGGFVGAAFIAAVDAGLKLLGA